MKVLVDMDGVLADFEGYLIQRWEQLYPDSYKIRPEERKHFYISRQLPKEWRPKLYQIMYAREFFASLPPIPGGKEALNEMRALGWQVHICSSPLIENRTGASEKFAWVEEHLGRDWVGDLILTSDKTLVRGDVLIDDRPELNGVETPTWEHVLYDQVYNRRVKGKRRLTWENWKEVLLES